jgi:hypothetical protein
MFATEARIRTQNAMVQQLGCMSQFEMEPSRAAQAKPGGAEPRFKITGTDCCFALLPIVATNSCSLGKLSRDHKDDCVLALGIAVQATILRQATYARLGGMG